MSPHEEFKALAREFTLTQGGNWHFFDGPNKNESTPQFRQWFKGKRKSKACSMVLAENDAEAKARNKEWKRVNGNRFQRCS